MTDELKNIIIDDIKRCERPQDVKEYQPLFQLLIRKYEGILHGSIDSICITGKDCADEPLDYCFEINVIKEKLQVILANEAEKDPLYQFKKIFNMDLDNLREAVTDVSNHDTPEFAKLLLYKDVTGKYHSYVPKLGEGLYGYYADLGCYDDCSGDSLRGNLLLLISKLTAFKALNYPGLLKVIETAPATVVNINNENKQINTITFDAVRGKIQNMTSLPENEIIEIMLKVDELEHIVQSSKNKSQKWDSAKAIIKWVADRGVDVGIALLPLLMQIY